MKVEIKLDSAYPQPLAIILTDSVTDEVTDAVRKLSEEGPHLLSGIRNQRLEVLQPQQITRVYAAAGKVYAATAKGEYQLRLRLYEAEERLSSHSFVRISNSEIINLKQVDHFDLSMAGTICVKMRGGDTTYVSRRCVAKVKQMLGL